MPRFSLTVHDMTADEAVAVAAALQALGCQPEPAPRAMTSGTSAAIAGELLQAQQGIPQPAGYSVNQPPVAPGISSNAPIGTPAITAETAVTPSVPHVGLATIAPQPPAPPAPPMPPVPQPPAAGAPMPPPPPLPSAAAPSAPSTVLQTAAPTGNTAAASGEVDKRGVPWHEDHHASNKAQTKEGVWVRRKKTDPNVVQAYEAQFINRNPAPQPPAPPAPPPPPAPASVPVPPVVGTVPPAPPPPAPPMPPVPQPPAPPAAPAAPSASELNAQHAPHVPNGGLNGAPAPVPTDYNTFFKTFSELAQSGRLTVEVVAWVCDQLQITQDQLSSVFTADETKRAKCYAWLLQLQAGQQLTPFA